MKIKFFCPRWGQAQIPWDDFARLVRSAGYHGVETDIPLPDGPRNEMLEALDKYGLLLIAQHWETVDPLFESHAVEYARRLEHMCSVRPLLINSQTGKDYFSVSQNARLLYMASSAAAATGIPVYHETHRGKFSFAAHITREFLQRVPSLELTLDISHWFAVAETWLKDQPQAVEQAVSRTRHLHARIGHPQGAQIADPRIPASSEALHIHLDVWDKVVEVNAGAGHSLLTITPEFGPPPYMQLSPSTGKPLADQWELNIFIMNLLTDRYSRYIDKKWTLQK